MMTCQFLPLSIISSYLVAVFVKGRNDKSLQLPSSATFENRWGRIERSSNRRVCCERDIVFVDFDWIASEMKDSSQEYVNDQRVIVRI